MILVIQMPGLVEVTRPTSRLSTTTQHTMVTKWIPKNPVITERKDLEPSTQIIEEKCRQATECDLDPELDDRICRSEFIMVVKLLEQRTVNVQNGGKIYYWIVQGNTSRCTGVKGVLRQFSVMRLFKTGKLNKFKRTPDGRARTRIFVECQNCPNLKKYQYYLIAGSELRRTHLMGNDPFYNGVINSNDLVVKV